MGHSLECSWEGTEARAVRAELKRRCETQTSIVETLLETQSRLHDIIFRGISKQLLVPCLSPVLGEGRGPGTYPADCWCPKCGNPKVTFVTGSPPERRAWRDGPCIRCLNSRPPAPTGYEYSGEWDRPKVGEHYLDPGGMFVVYKENGFGPDDATDGGKRWILRKKPESVCPKCGKIADVAFPCSFNGGVCVSCWIERPDVPPGYNHAGAWRPPKSGEFYIGDSGDIVFLCEANDNRGPVNDSSRWILRKVEEAKFEVRATYLAIGCPSCGRMRLEAEPGTDPIQVACDKCGFTTREVEMAGLSLSELTRRVEKLEKEKP